MEGRLARIGWILVALAGVGIIVAGWPALTAAAGWMPAPTDRRRRRVLGNPPPTNWSVRAVSRARRCAAGARPRLQRQGAMAGSTGRPDTNGVVGWCCWFCYSAVLPELERVVQRVFVTLLCYGSRFAARADPAPHGRASSCSDQRDTVIVRSSLQTAIDGPLDHTYEPRHLDRRCRLPDPRCAPQSSSLTAGLARAGVPSRRARFEEAR